MLVLLAFCAFVASLVMAKPSQRQSKSHHEVAKAKLSLDRKIAKLHAKVAASDIKEAKRPDGVLTESCR